VVAQLCQRPNDAGFYFIKKGTSCCGSVITFFCTADEEIRYFILRLNYICKKFYFLGIAND